jgi:transposase
MQKFTESLGIDVSKNTLDAVLHIKQLHQQFDNSPKGFRLMLRWALKNHGATHNLLFCFEHTGWYCLELSWFLEANSIGFHCASPLHLKRSLGFRRGKTDKTDAFDIARFAWINRDNLTLSKAPSPILIDLQRMMALRDQLIKHTTALKNQKHAMKTIVAKEYLDDSILIIKQCLFFNQTQIKRIEKQMIDLIFSIPEYAVNYKLLMGIKGFGFVITMQIIIHTHNFSRFDNWRQFSAYCGLVPYPYQSGTSFYRRPKTHSICDKQLKSLLSMSAICALQYDPELKLYYNRRLNEGKEKMLVINIIRNKLVARAFAVVKRQTPFIELAKFAA